MSKVWQSHSFLEASRSRAAEVVVCLYPRVWFSVIFQGGQLCSNSHRRPFLDQIPLIVMVRCPGESCGLVCSRSNRTNPFKVAAPLTADLIDERV
jgi:hypothetical protein